VANRVRRWRRGLGICTVVAVGGLVLPAIVRAQQEPAVTMEQVVAAIDQLGKLDYAVRAKASQVVRRAAPPVAVTALLRTIDEHADGYVRFRALVLLSGFNDPRTYDVMLRAIDDPNDRLREVGYAWFEAHPDKTLAGSLLQRLPKEQAEFVRPALIRALAALGSDPSVQKVLVQEAYRGQDFFRSAVIEALGDHRAAYALPALAEIAKLDGPLRDDAVLALGRIGDVRAVETLAVLQRAARREDQPLVAAAICLTGRNCESHRRFVSETLAFAVKEIGFQELLRSAATGLGALAERGDLAAFQTLTDTGIATQDPARAPIALALGRVAVRNPAFTVEALAKVSHIDEAVLLLRDGFDMLEEDFEEERFYVTVRRGYWKAASESASRRVANKLISVLEF
jgi:HEAT repeat protein